MDDRERYRAGAAGRALATLTAADVPVDTVEGCVDSGAVLSLRQRIADAIDPEYGQVILNLRAGTLIDTPPRAFQVCTAA